MPKKIVSTIVDSDDESDELEKVKDELEVSKSQLTALALREFETQKAELLSKISDPQKREEVSELIDSGEDLKRVQTMVDVIQSGITYGLTHDEPTKKRPKGQASLEPYPTRSQQKIWESAEAMVSEIYDNLEVELFKKYMGKNYSKKRLDHYQNMADRLLSSMIKGFQNRETSKIGKWQVMQCKKCSKILRNNESICPKCGARVMVGVSGQGW